MVFLLALALQLSSCCNAVSGQAEIQRSPRHRKYVHIVKLMNVESATGLIIRMDSRQIEFQRFGRIAFAKRISVDKIKSIKIHRKGNGFIGFLLGAIAGGLLGELICQDPDKSPPPPQASCWQCGFGWEGPLDLHLFSLQGMMIGGFAGTVIGSKTFVKKFEINGDSVAFEKASKVLMKSSNLK